MKQLIRGLVTGAGLGAVMLTASLAAQGPTKVEMKDAQGQTVSLRIAGDSSAGESVEFGASGTVITFRGFLAAYEEGRDADREAAEGDEERRLPNLSEGDSVELRALDPPPSYGDRGGGCCRCRGSDRAERVADEPQQRQARAGAGDPDAVPDPDGEGRPPAAGRCAGRVRSADR